MGRRRVADRHLARWKYGGGLRCARLRWLRFGFGECFARAGSTAAGFGVPVRHALVVQAQHLGGGELVLADGTVGGRVLGSLAEERLETVPFGLGPGRPIGRCYRHGVAQPLAPSVIFTIESLW